MLGPWPQVKERICQLSRENDPGSYYDIHPLSAYIWSLKTEDPTPLCPKPLLPLALFGPLRGLGPKLHHYENKQIRRAAKERRNPNIPPTIRLVFDITRGEVIRSRRVGANLAVGRRFRIEQVRAGIDG